MSINSLCLRCAFSCETWVTLSTSCHASETAIWSTCDEIEIRHASAILNACGSESAICCTSACGSSTCSWSKSATSTWSPNENEVLPCGEMETCCPFQPDNFYFQNNVMRTKLNVKRVLVKKITIWKLFELSYSCQFKKIQKS